MLTKTYVTKVQWLRWCVVLLSVVFQVYLMWKYEINLLDTLLWGVLLSGAYTLIRVSSVTEGIVHTIMKEEMYRKVKRMLFDDDERNTPDRFHK